MAYENTGYQNAKILRQRNSDDGSLTGKIMPNIPMISPQAIIDGTTNSITFNYPLDSSPSGGINGDITYNAQSDTLYKKISGVWTLLSDRVTNDKYIAPVLNTDFCPLPTTP
jgi:hypothetical protein